MVKILLFQWILKDLRRSVAEVLKRREKGEERSRNELKVAVTQVVHEIYVSYVECNGGSRDRAAQQSRYQRYPQDQCIANVLRKRMYHRCNQNYALYYFILVSSQQIFQTTVFDETQFCAYLNNLILNSENIRDHSTRYYIRYIY